MNAYKPIGPDERDMIVTALKQTTSSIEDIAVTYNRSVDTVIKIACANGVGIRDKRYGWQATIDRLDTISRLRALTEQESLLLEKAIKRVSDARKVTKRIGTGHKAASWTKSEDDALCEFSANGGILSINSPVKGRTVQACKKRFDRIMALYGEQAR